MREILFNNWHFARWMRLILGLFFVIQAIHGKDFIAGFFGAFLLFQAAMNTGCGLSGCAHQIPEKRNLELIDEPDFEIIKPKNNGITHI